MRNPPVKEPVHVLTILEQNTAFGFRWYVGLFEGLFPLGFRFEVVNLSSSAEFGEEIGPFAMEYRELGRTGRYPAAIPALRSEIRDSRPDLIHASEFIPAGYAAVANRLCGGRRARLVYTRHHSGGLSGRQRFLDRLAMRWSDRVVSVADHALEATAQEYPRHREKLVRIYNGIDLRRGARPGGNEDESALERLRQGRDGATVLLLARLRPSKGHRVALEALKILLERGVHVRLVFAGDGSEKETLEQRIRAMGLSEQALMVGPIQDVQALLDLTDVLVIPSFEETFGLIAIEAMSSGVSVVASAVGGLREVLSDGETGLLFPPGDPGALADAVERCLQDPEKARARAEAAKRDYEARFTPEVMAREYGALFRHLLES